MRSIKDVCKTHGNGCNEATMKRNVSIEHSHYDTVIAANRRQQDMIVTRDNKIQSLQGEIECLKRELSKVAGLRQELSAFKLEVSRLKEDATVRRGIWYKPDMSDSNELSVYKQAVVNDAVLLGHKDKTIFKLQNDIEQYKAVITERNNQRQDVIHRINRQHAIIKQRLSKVLEGL